MTTFSSLSSHRTTGERSPARRTERPITVRLDEERLSLVTGLAILDDTTVAEQIRLATEIYVRARLDDPSMSEKTEHAVDRFRSGFAPLLEGTPDTGDVASEDAPAPPERDLDTEKPLTLRVANRMMDYLTALALLDSQTIADQLRAAVDLYLAQRRNDPELEAQISESREDRDDLLSRLVPA
jgi:hypothetical protein